uniref:Uncharacterized protein n=1 Tax=Arundo donax TaxID=35708 RepID=A0A0A9DQ47_ARUDO
MYSTWKPMSCPDQIRHLKELQNTPSTTKAFPKMHILLVKL